MTRAWLLSLGISLLLTEAMELSGALISGKRRTALLVVVLANLLTNPPVVLTVLLWRHYALPCPMGMIVLLEVLAVLVEALVYRLWRRDFPHPWRLSLILNLISYFTGALLQAIL